MPSERDLAKDIRTYVAIGGRDAFSFSLYHKPYHGDIPGKDLQRMIDEEYERQNKEAVD